MAYKWQIEGKDGDKPFSISLEHGSPANLKAALEKEGFTITGKISNPPGVNFIPIGMNGENTISIACTKKWD